MASSATARNRCLALVALPLLLVTESGHAQSWNPGSHSEFEAHWERDLHGHLPEPIPLWVEPRTPSLNLGRASVWQMLRDEETGGIGQLGPGDWALRLAAGVAGAAIGYGIHEGSHLLAGEITGLRGR